MRRLALPLAAAALALNACATSAASTTYDETDFRADVEKQIGHPVANWPAYMDAARHSCTLNEQALPMFLAIGQSNDPGLHRASKIGIAYLCPQRYREVIDFER
jgi:hypothetical protein